MSRGIVGAYKHTSYSAILSKSGKGRQRYIMLVHDG